MDYINLQRRHNEHTRAHLKKSAMKIHRTGSSGRYQLDSIKQI